MPQSASSVWIASHVLSAIRAEANSKAPLETGGVLLGCWTIDDEPVVTHSVGPGPCASHSEDLFRPDHEHQEAEIARLYGASGRRLSYLGDWHSHPGGASMLSDRDHACLRDIARFKEARVKHPIMVILAGAPILIPVAWQYLAVRRWLWRRPIVRRLAVREFAAEQDSRERAP